MRTRVGMRPLAAHDTCSLRASITFWRGPGGCFGTSAQGMEYPEQSVLRARNMDGGLADGSERA